MEAFGTELDLLRYERQHKLYKYDFVTVPKQAEAFQRVWAINIQSLIEQFECELVPQDECISFLAVPNDDDNDDEYIRNKFVALLPFRFYRLPDEPSRSYEGPFPIWGHAAVS